jgi:hypothetical protein
MYIRLPCDGQAQPRKSLLSANNIEANIHRHRIINANIKENKKLDVKDQGEYQRFGLHSDRAYPSKPADSE